MIDKYTAQAPTKEAAIEKGLKELGITRDKAKIEITTPGKKGFLGIGQKDAVVTVSRKEKTSIMDEVDLLSSKETQTAGSENQTLDKTAAVEKTEEETTTPPVSTENVKESDSEEKKEIQETFEEVENQAVAPPVHSMEKAEDELTDQVDEEDSKPSEEEEKKERERQAKIEEQDEKAIQEVHSYLKDILLHMGVEDAEVDVRRDKERVLFDVKTEDAGLVIGRHGKVLNGLQTLIQIQLHQLADTKLFAKVDTENYRNRRKDTVERLAKKTANQVVKTNQQVILEPMPAHERKQIHRHLYKDSRIKTYSEGKEPHRYLVVEPSDV